MEIYATIKHNDTVANLVDKEPGTYSLDFELSFHWQSEDLNFQNWLNMHLNNNPLLKGYNPDLIDTAVLIARNHLPDLEIVFQQPPDEWDDEEIERLGIVF